MHKVRSGDNFNCRSQTKGLFKKQTVKNTKEAEQDKKHRYSYNQQTVTHGAIANDLEWPLTSLQLLQPFPTPVRFID